MKDLRSEKSYQGHYRNKIVDLYGILFWFEIQYIIFWCRVYFK